MAHRMIKAGYPVVLWARREETLDPFRNTSARFASSIDALATQVSHAGVCVVGDDGVTEVCEKLIASMHPGGRIAIHSTVLPDTCKTLARQAGVSGLSLIDAPVSGGQPAADAGALTVMMGGAPEAVAATRPVFETFGNLLIHLGEIGAGQTAKLINNSLMAANVGLVHCAVSAGVEAGLGREELLQLLGASSGRSFALDVYARSSGSGGFSRAHTLIEKVHLLGKVLGSDHETYRLLRDAASQLVDKSPVEK